ncbi:hypothetical protein M422DRAFT_273862 [Sphaerobolus stellatus SS14]|uniref:Uncharacterized protein n=1 Tax=Sphaerobolus stellatus (strain SS14) TaxID=990650 RepID=A0A0C9U7W8_SPHS4|nr:hypothetical protein M422DRAFT_273862 [Sphaerobolus stellatus SS14]
MGDHLMQANDSNETALPEDGIVWTHGDLVLSNIKLLGSDCVAFLDLGTAFFGPQDWDVFALRTSEYGYEVEFKVPMVKAFDRKGLQLREDRQAMYETFMLWHAKKGGAVARQERKGALKSKY